MTSSILYETEGLDINGVQLPTACFNVGADKRKCFVKVEQSAGAAIKGPLIKATIPNSGNRET